MIKTILNFMILSVLISLAPGCDQDDRINLSTYRTLDENLKLSNEQIMAGTNTMIHIFRSYSNDPLISSKSNILLENMLLVSKLSDKAKNQIKTIKLGLEKKITEGKKEYDSAGTKKVFEYFDKAGHGAELFQLLVNYRKSIWQINPDLYMSFKNENYFFNARHTSYVDSDSLFNKAYFDKVPLAAALAMLTKFQNDICMYEFRAIQFFYVKLDYNRPVFNSKSPSK